MNEELEREIQDLEVEVHCLYARRDPLRREPNSNNRVFRMRRDVKQLARFYRQRGARIDVHLPVGPILAATILREYGSAAGIEHEIQGLEAARVAAERDNYPALHHAAGLLLERAQARLEHARRAERVLARDGWSYQPDSGELQGSEGFTTDLIRDAFRILEPKFRKACPEETEPNPRLLREHLAILLRPYLGELHDTVISEVIDNHDGRIETV